MLCFTWVRLTTQKPALGELFQKHQFCYKDNSKKSNNGKNWFWPKSDVQVFVHVLHCVLCSWPTLKPYAIRSVPISGWCEKKNPTKIYITEVHNWVNISASVMLFRRKTTAWLGLYKSDLGGDRGWEGRGGGAMPRRNEHYEASMWGARELWRGNRLLLRAVSEPHVAPLFAPNVNLVVLFCLKSWASIYYSWQWCSSGKHTGDYIKEHGPRSRPALAYCIPLNPTCPTPPPFSPSHSSHKYTKMPPNWTLHKYLVKNRKWSLTMLLTIKPNYLTAKHNDQTNNSLQQGFLFFFLVGSSGLLG